MEIRRVVTRMTDVGSKGVLQVEGVDQKFPVQVTDRAKHGERWEVKLASAEDAKLFSEALKKGGPAVECKVLVFFSGQAIVGAYGRFQGLEREVVALDYPKKVVRIQRRAHARFWVLGGYDLQVRMDAIEGPKRKVAKKLVDISAGGLAFLVVSPREASLFREGMIVRGLHLKLQNRDMVFDVEVRTHEETKRESQIQGIRVGVKFVNIAPEDVDWIQSFVLYHVGHTLF